MGAALFLDEVRSRRDQCGPTGGFMSVICDCDTIDDVTGVAFGDCAIAMGCDGTGTGVADSGDSDAIDREMGCAYAHHLSTV
jgi:hypothetical protein